jgi:hypothetical protein
MRRKEGLRTGAVPLRGIHRIIGLGIDVCAMKQADESPFGCLLMKGLAA